MGSRPPGLGLTSRRLVACSGVVILGEVVVYCVLGCECVGFGFGVRVRVKKILPWRGLDVVRGVAGVLFLKVCL